MIILHLSILEGKIALWGESPAEETSPQSPPPARPSRRSRSSSTPGSAPAPGMDAPVFPFAARPEALASLKKESIGFKIPHGELRNAVAWLPSQDHLPVPSSPVIADLPQTGVEPRLAPWLITVLPLAWDQATELLASSAEKHLLAPGLILGDEFPFWVHLLRFAASLTVRQQFLPSVRAENELHRAVWEPVIIGEDSARLSALVRAMPSVAFAVIGKATTYPPAPQREQAVGAVLSGFLDYFVRTGPPASVYAVPAVARGKAPAPRFATLHDQWMSALRSPEGTMQGPPSELAGFARQVADWRRPVAVAQKAGFRLCFRLAEPQDDRSDSWCLQYLLQPVADRSLLVPIDELWSRNSAPAAVRRQFGPAAREYVLSSLGHAAALSPHIAKSLAASVPAICLLNTTEAHQFLTETSLALEQAGFGVMLPAWWSGKGARLRLSAGATVKSPAMQGSGMLSLDAIVRFDWELALGDEKITLQELEALAKMKAPLVKLRGQWVELDSDEIRRAIQFWRSNRHAAVPVADLVRAELGASELLSGIPVKDIAATGWVGTLLDRLKGHDSIEDLPAPGGFVGALRPYQVRGYSWMAFLRKCGLGACLADDMGLGKTIQVLALIQHDWEEGRKKPVLIVCPTSVVENWRREAHRFTPDIPVMVHHGADRRKGRGLKQEARKHAVVISTYALLQRDLEHLQPVSWAGVVLDEAQNIKNSETKQARAARELNAGYRIALSGTPVENHVGDLWSILEFLNPGFLGTRADFKRTFFLPIQTGRNPQAAERLKRITTPFILRRLKTDRSIIADLPEKMEMKVFCSLTREQTSLYASVLREIESPLARAEGITRKGIILATLSKLKQVCNHPAHFLGDNSSIPDRSGKLSRLTEMLEEVLEAGDRALVFSQFAEMGAILKKHLQAEFGFEVPFLHGGVLRSRRDEMVERFQNDDRGPQIFVLSLKAGGTGLNLTRASHVFHFDRWWNPAVEQQATDRVFRIGQKKNVQVHKFVCAGTLEEKIDEMIEKKRAIAEQVVGTGEGWLTELSNDQIRELFALRKELVEA